MGEKKEYINVSFTSESGVRFNVQESIDCPYRLIISFVITIESINNQNEIQWLVYKPCKNQISKSFFIEKTNPFHFKTLIPWWFIWRKSLEKKTELKFQSRKCPKIRRISLSHKNNQYRHMTLFAHFRLSKCKVSVYIWHIKCQGIMK